MAGKLKPLDVARETRPGKYADGDDLCLIVTSCDLALTHIKKKKRNECKINEGLRPFMEMSNADAKQYPFLCKLGQGTAR
jgi:hypothetical protein